MRALKVLVVVMGALLIAGVAVIIFTIMTRLSQKAMPPPVTAHLSPFGNTAVMLPPDSLVMEVQGIGDRILLRLDLKDGTEMLLVLDAATGTELGRIKLDHENSQ